MNYYITERYYHWLYQKWAIDHWTIDAIAAYLGRDRYLVERDLDKVIGTKVGC